MPAPLDEQYTWPELVDRTYNRVKDWIPEEKEFKEWMMKREKCGYLFDFFLIGRLFLIHKLKLQKKNDYVVVIVGREGSGKSTLGIQINSWIDPDNFDHTKVCMDANAFRKFLLHSNKPGLAGQIDEGALSLFSREAMTRQGRDMVKIFMTVRIKSLFINICCPSFNELDSYIRRHRVALLINITERGSYTAYFDEAIKRINDRMKKGEQLDKIWVPDGFMWQGNFRRTFPKYFDEPAYEKMKLSYVNDFLKEVNLDQEEDNDPLMLPLMKAARKMGITHWSLRHKIDHKQIHAKKQMNRWYIPMKEIEKWTNMSNIEQIDPNRTLT